MKTHTLMLNFHVICAIIMIMQETIKRENERSGIEKLLKVFPVTAIIGPRQCGKTWLARTFRYDHYFDLENPRDAALFKTPQMTLERLRGLIIIDEIQRAPEIFPLLRFLVDTKPDQRYLILGSASGSLLHQSSESLAGRIGYYELGGLTLRDCGADFLDALWLRGGFPRATLAETDEDAM
jgi:predicted AAA+ superfamily ATPase